MAEKRVALRVEKMAVRRRAVGKAVMKAEKMVLTSAGSMVVWTVATMVS